MFEVVLYEPEIPPNTGNVVRLCANTGARLHLIEPLGFVLSDRRMRRAGLDYRDRTSLSVYPSLAHCKQVLTGRRWFALSSRGQYGAHDVAYRAGDVFLFGPETRGLPPAVLDEVAPAHVLRLPMVTGERSLNLANAVAIVVYEAWRQLGFAGAAARSV